MLDFACLNERLLLGTGYSEGRGTPSAEIRFGPLIQNDPRQPEHPLNLIG